MYLLCACMYMLLIYLNLNKQSCTWFSGWSNTTTEQYQLSEEKKACNSMPTFFLIIKDNTVFWLCTTLRIRHVFIMQWYPYCCIVYSITVGFHIVKDLVGNKTFFCLYTPYHHIPLFILSHTIFTDTKGPTHIHLL